MVPRPKRKFVEKLHRRSGGRGMSKQRMIGATLAFVVIEAMGLWSAYAYGFKLPSKQFGDLVVLNNCCAGIAAVCVLFIP